MVVTQLKIRYMQFWTTTISHYTFTYTCTIFRAILRLPETFRLSQSSIMVQIMPKANKIVIEQLVLIDLHFNPLELVTY